MRCVATKRALFYAAVATSLARVIKSKVCDNVGRAGIGFLRFT